MVAAYASNDGYARHLAASMCSLFDNNQSEEMIRVYILSNRLSEENIGRLKSIADKYGREMVVVELGDVRSRFPYEIDTRGFDVSALSRFFMAEMIPAHEERILYLDCDTIVKDSLTPLWELPLEGYALAAAMEPTVGMNIKGQIDLTREDAYYNSGVLLINLAYWRREKVQEKLLDFYRERDGRLFACDQDTINGALRGKIRLLDPRYNFFTNLKYFPYSSLVVRTAEYAAVTKEQLTAAKKNPAVLHYLGDERPWKRGNLNPYRKYYTKYLAMTPYAGTKKETGMELYLLIYHLMEWMTLVFPEVRFAINDTMGMWVIDRRSRKSRKTS
ncbi:MAG: glycosyltransferase family 8 protein [Lachnospiraceae bacterium]|nr:glycosyltransferase family 8 protein [Lachnospiraceae bacterium]